MSVTIKLCCNKSANNQLSKSPTELYSTTGVIKKSTSILDPVLILQGIGSYIPKLNYIKISEFKRNYFVTDIISVSNDVWEIHCHVDVLGTYAIDILNTKAVILRQKNKYNLYLDDGMFKAYQNPHIVTKKFPNGFNTHEYVLIVAGS